MQTHYTDKTVRLYDADSHMRTFTATVADCRPAGEGWQVALDQTCFFPEGGGQPGDRGTLTPLDGGEPLAVSDTREAGGQIWHITQAPLPTGTGVTGTLDWSLRFARMQCHSGEHLVSGLFHSRYGLDNVGFHLGDEEMTIDLSGPVTWADVEEVERQANAAVALDLPVIAAYPPPDTLAGLDYRSKLELEGPVRIITIPGYDVCACCAPHVGRTGEIGLIHFLSMQNWKGGVRLRLLCGSRAVADVMAKRDSVVAISQKCSVKQGDVAGAVDRLTGELDQAKARIKALGRALAQARADTLPDPPGDLLLFEELDTDALRTLVNAAVDRGAGICAAFVPDGDRWQYILGSAKTDLRPLVKEMNAALSGRGGGTAQMVQGSVTAERGDIEAWWQARLARRGEE